MTKSRRKAKQEREWKRLTKFQQSLEYQLCEILQQHCGERGDNEGAVETLDRILRERDRALTVLALDRLKHSEPGGPMRLVPLPPNAR